MVARRHHGAAWRNMAQQRPIGVRCCLAKMTIKTTAKFEIKSGIEGSGSPEVVPTKAMVLAGARVLWEGLPKEFSWESSYALELAKLVYLAMRAAEETSKT